jgi:hypothetical protein
MTLMLILNAERKPKRVKPIDHFSHCPACGCAELIDAGPDVLCLECDWDSTLWDVGRGGMNNLRLAAREFGFSAPLKNPEQKIIMLGGAIAAVEGA